VNPIVWWTRTNKCKCTIHIFPALFCSFCYQGDTDHFLSLRINFCQAEQKLKKNIHFDFASLEVTLGALQFDQKFQNFWNGDKWYKFPCRVSRKSGIVEFPFNREFRNSEIPKIDIPYLTCKVILFSGKFLKILFHSSLEIFGNSNRTFSSNGSRVDLWINHRVWHGLIKTISSTNFQRKGLTQIVPFAMSKRDNC